MRIFYFLIVLLCFISFLIIGSNSNSLTQDNTTINSTSQTQSNNSSVQPNRICHFRLTTDEANDFINKVSSAQNSLYKIAEERGIFDNLSEENKEEYKNCYEEYAFIKESDMLMNKKCPWRANLRSKEAIFRNIFLLCNNRVNSNLQTNITLPLN